MSNVLALVKICPALKNPYPLSDRPRRTRNADTSVLLGPVLLRSGIPGKNTTPQEEKPTCAAEGRKYWEPFSPSNPSKHTVSEPNHEQAGYGTQEADSEKPARARGGLLYRFMVIAAFRDP